MAMKMTVLIENTSAPYLKCEHGLSILIENNCKKYLLDAGGSSAFLDNAKVLGLSLDDVDACILSHGHYDHSGGFLEYLSKNKRVSVYAMESVCSSYYSVSGGMHEISIPKQVVNAHFDRFCLIKGFHVLTDGVFLIPHSSKNLDLIGRKAGLFKKCGGEYFPDDFSHELSLVFDTDNGLIIFNSCSHAGIINIINEVKAALPGRKIHAFIGGLHMEGKEGVRRFCTFSEAEIKDMADILEKTGLKFLYTGHCTGEEGFKLLKKHLGEKMIRLTSGLQAEI